MKKRFLNMVVCATLILAVIPGCSSDEEGSASTSTSTSTTTAEKVTTESSEVVTAPQVDKEEIKKTYQLSEEEAAILADENSPKPITYGGFESKVFATPALNNDAALVTITPLYSHSGVHQYLHEYETVFDLGNGDGSFSAAAESYTDEFFSDKALLIISFLDKEGGANYSVNGGWDDHVVGEGFEMDRFILGIKKTDGNVTAGHVIVEIDKDFLGIWDTFGMEIYR